MGYEASGAINHYFSKQILFATKIQQNQKRTTLKGQPAKRGKATTAMKGRNQLAQRGQLGSAALNQGKKKDRNQATNASRTQRFDGTQKANIQKARKHVHSRPENNEDDESLDLPDVEAKVKSPSGRHRSPSGVQRQSNSKRSSESSTSNITLSQASSKNPRKRNSQLLSSDEGDEMDNNLRDNKQDDEFLGDQDDDDDGDDDDEDDKEDDQEENRYPRVNNNDKDFEDDERHGDQDDDEDNYDDNEDEDNNEEVGFTDDNAKWLKPKQTEQSKHTSKLLESDDDDVQDDEFHIGQDDAMDEQEDDEQEEDDEDDDEELEVERQSRLLDEELLAQEAEADQELRRTIAEHTDIYHLPTKDELEKDASDRVVAPSDFRSRVDSILEVLADFKNRREAGRPRKDYVEQLIADISELYGYLPELIDYFHSMFGPAETLEFVDASDKPRPLVIRTNTLKARRKDLAASLMKRGVTLDPLASWSKVGLKIVESPVPVGATPEYLSGMYMLQSAASMCPVMALSPQVQEKVLDMSAAPGGKTSYISQLMRNTGVILANDLKPERQKATVANMHRLGVKNVIACALDGRKIGKMFHHRFDRVLLDAPCSGLGVISRDPSVKIQRTLVDVQRCAHLQKELLLAAIDALNHKSKTGGVMVYSTCSVSVAENEEVINYALSKRDVKIIDTGLDFGKPGFTRYQQKRFHPSVALTRRFYPHVHNMDGFYVAKIQKFSDRQLDDATSLQQHQTSSRKGDGDDSGDSDDESKIEVNENVEMDSDDDEVGKQKGRKYTEKRKLLYAEGKSAVTKKRRKDSNSDAKGKQGQNKAKNVTPTKNSAHSTNRAGTPDSIKSTSNKKKSQSAKMTKPRRPKASDVV